MDTSNLWFCIIIITLDGRWYANAYVKNKIIFLMLITVPLSESSVKLSCGKSKTFYARRKDGQIDRR